MGGRLWLLGKRLRETVMADTSGRGWTDGEKRGRGWCLFVCLSVNECVCVEAEWEMEGGVVSVCWQWKSERGNVWISWGERERIFIHLWGWMVATHTEWQPQLRAGFMGVVVHEWAGGGAVPAWQMFRWAAVGASQCSQVPSFCLFLPASVQMRELWIIY